MNKYNEITKLISERLEKISDFDCCNYSKLLEAQKYSLTAGGKHLRALILIKCAMLGGVSVESVIDFACAVEMVHTYSLIHDDLPEMDNDDLRRGKPTCHKKYGQAIALLAGDALLTKAFGIIASNTYFSDDVKLKCIGILSDKSGEHGMLAGQTIDKCSENMQISASRLEELHARKTGDMFIASVMIGCELGKLSVKITSNLIEYIKLLGIAFQIKDDILDVVSTTDVLGKPTNSDDKCEKSTFVSVYGLEQAQEILNEKIASAIDIAKNFNDNFFVELAEYFLKRNK